MSQQPARAFETKQLSAQHNYLAPDGSKIRLLPEVSGGGLAHCTLPNGALSKATAHRTVEEIWYCISGMGQVWRKLGDVEEVVDFLAGIGLTIPKGTSFQFRNTGDDPLCFLIATIPRWPGEQEAMPVSGYWKTD